MCKPHILRIIIGLIPLRMNSFLGLEWSKGCSHLSNKSVRNPKSLDNFIICFKCSIGKRFSLWRLFTAEGLSETFLKNWYEHRMGVWKSPANYAEEHTLQWSLTEYCQIMDFIFLCHIFSMHQAWSIQKCSEMAISVMVLNHSTWKTVSSASFRSETTYCFRKTSMFLLGGEWGGVGR